MNPLEQFTKAKGSMAADDVFPELKGAKPYNHEEHERKKHYHGLTPVQQIILMGDSNAPVSVADDFSTVVVDDFGTIVSGDKK